MPPSPSSTRSPAPAYDCVAIIGAGAWGSALALVAAGNASKVLLWAREPEVVESIRAVRENRPFLPGVRIPDTIEATGESSRIAEADAALLVTPAQHMRTTLHAMSGFLKPGMPVVICAKGIETGTGLLLDEVLGEVLPEAEPAILSGPSFARDVARGLPTAVTIAAREAVAARLLATLGRAHFRPYVTEDLVGVALGG